VDGLSDTRKLLLRGASHLDEKSACRRLAAPGPECMLEFGPTLPEDRAVAKSTMKIIQIVLDAKLLKPRTLQQGGKR